MDQRTATGEELPPFKGGDETEGARIGGCRRHPRQVCRQLKNLR
jgi:hypothetical protein